MATSRPAPRTNINLPVSKRKLFQYRTQSVQPPSNDRTAKISASNYLKQMTSFFTLSLSYMALIKLTADFANIRHSPSDIACKIFGEHGSAPCLSPCCSKPKEFLSMVYFRRYQIKIVFKSLVIAGFPNSVLNLFHQNRNKLLTHQSFFFQTTLSFIFL